MQRGLRTLPAGSLHRGSWTAYAADVVCDHTPTSIKPGITPVVMAAESLQSMSSHFPDTPDPSSNVQPPQQYTGMLVMTTSRTSCRHKCRDVLVAQPHAQLLQGQRLHVLQLWELVAPPALRQSAVRKCLAHVHEADDLLL